MIIRVSELPTEGLTVRDASQFTLADPSWRLDSVSLDLHTEGADVLVEGDIEAVVPQDCSRCLEPFSVTVHAHVDVRVSPRPAPTAENIELAADDLDQDFYANDELDLGAIVQTETTLALPMKALCREDCRGLCPVCGGNRNVVMCNCREREPDPRLVALKDLSARLGH